MHLFYLSAGYLMGMGVWLACGGIALYLLVRLRQKYRGRPRPLLAIHSGLSLWMFLALLTFVELYFALLFDKTDSFNITNVSNKWFDVHVVPDLKVLRFGGNEGIRYRDDQEFPSVTPAGTRHVCFVGDSFTFGHGVAKVSDRFSNRVRTRLSERESGAYFVSNLSEAGTDLLWVDRLLEKLFARKQRIDDVVYVMCLNDIESFHPQHMAIYEDISSHGANFFLFRDTYFFNLLYFRYRQFQLPAVRGYYSFVKEYYEDYPWRRMQQKLLETRDRCHQGGATFRVVVFPFLHNLGADYQFREIHAQIVEFCRVQGIPVLDLEPILSPHADEGLIVSRFDAHPNERAHELAADAIVEAFFPASKRAN